jgi:predicted unusual protein kinase regulating ubiquinone biosynthesis (AarF/ABC1/UbiB family)
MEYLPGLGVDSAEIAALSQERRNKLAQDLLALLFREIYEFHAVQTDPHFGNYRIRLSEKGEPDRWVLYDFGAVREFSPEFTDAHLAFLRGLLQKDHAGFEAAACKMKVLEPSDTQELKDYLFELCALIVEPFSTDSYAWGESDLPKRVAKQALEIPKRFSLRTPPREIIFLDRKMLGVFTALTVLKAKINGREILDPYLRR